MKKLLLLLGVGLTTVLNAQSIPSYVPTNGLLVWYPLDTLGASNPAPDGNTNVGRDLSGNSHHWSAGTHYIPKADRHGNIGGATSSDTSTFQTPFTGVLGQGSRSVSLWLKSKLAPSTNGFVFFAYGAETAGNRFSGHLDFNCSGFGVGSAYSTITNSFNIDTNWHHLVYVFDSTYCNSNCSVDDVIIYVDGQPSSTCNTVSPNISINTISSYPLRLLFGASSTPDSLKYTIDDFGMWDRPLSSSEVVSLFNSQSCSVFDTVLLSVTDTLIIDVNFIGFNPVQFEHSVKAYPNPAKDHLVMDIPSAMITQGYSIDIKNAAGQSVYQSQLNQAQLQIDLTTWGNGGLYFLHLLDSSGSMVDVKKIILQ